MINYISYIKIMTGATNDVNNTFDIVKDHLNKFSKPHDLLAWKSIGESFIY